VARCQWGGIIQHLLPTIDVPTKDRALYKNAAMAAARIRIGQGGLPFRSKECSLSRKSQEADRLKAP